MEVALGHLIPKVLHSIADPPAAEVRVFSGKANLLRNLPNRLRGYAAYAEAQDLRILVLVDRDADDCRTLKANLEEVAAAAGLSTRAGSGGALFRVCNRIAIEELEAWFVGDPDAVAAAYAGVPASFGNRAKFRRPDEVSGGTWEALERLLKKHRHHRGGLAKVRLAHDVAPRMDVSRNRSPSFRAFRSGLRELVTQ